MADHVSRILAEHGAARHLIDAGAEGLIARWKAFVDQGQVGYNLCLEDYRNDLDLRSLIELAGIADKVAADDARFRALLTETDVELWSSDAPDPWWTRGYPHNAGPVLLDDLRAEELI